MTRHTIGDRIFLVRFDSQYALASTFLRVQEHYESRRFRGRVFTLEEYMDWYAATVGAFTYFEDWSGFNVPSTAFADFRAGRFDPLLRKEQRLLSLFPEEMEPFYVIATASDEALKHECAHALYFTQPRYRRQVRNAMRQYDTSRLEHYLTGLSYHRRVLADEAHAYLIDGGHDLPVGHLQPLRRTLQAIYRRYAAELELPGTRTARRRTTAVARTTR